MNNNYERKVRKIGLSDGTEETIVIEPTNSVDLNVKGPLSLSNNPFKNKVFKKKNILTRDIGVGSQGFAKTITIASIISILGVIILIIIFKY